LRRKLAPYLATILENPAYGATFALFLLSDNDAEREAALHELGISAADVESIRSRVGAGYWEDLLQRRRWFSAIFGLLTGETGARHLDPAMWFDDLVGAGFSALDSRHLIELGGGTLVRADTTPNGALWLLASRGLDLRDLHNKLRLLGDEGLNVRVARTLLRQWVNANGRRVAAVLARRRPSPDEAKAEIETWEPPSHLAFALERQLRSYWRRSSHR
jgi:hypothetical protein